MVMYFRRGRRTTARAVLCLSLWFTSGSQANAAEVVVDNSDAGFAVLSGTWSTGTSATPYGPDYRWRATVTGAPTGEVRWQANLPAAGAYEVFVWYVAGANRSTAAPFMIEHGAGSSSVLVNQQIGGSGWMPIGTFGFEAGTPAAVRLSNNAPGSVVIADAVRFVGNAVLPIEADLDADQDVDLGDFAFFQACVTGADAGPATSACTFSDFDGDRDVDQADFGVFQRCLNGSDVPAAADCMAGPIPSRPAGATAGSAFVQQVWSTVKSTREQLVAAELTRGNLPEFLRKFVPVTVTATIDAVPHTATFYVMPDYLAVGSDGDFLRFPMGPRTAQAIGDAFGCTMPTRKMVNDIYTAASVKLAPHPYSPTVYNIESVEVFNFSNTTIEQQRAAAGATLGELVGGTKKDVVISAQLASHPNKVAIYGWHQLNGQPIQPLYLGHDINYMDYSHGIRLVRQVMMVDGRPQLIQDVLQDPVLCQMISDEGVVTDPRYH